MYLSDVKQDRVNETRHLPAIVEMEMDPEVGMGRDWWKVWWIGGDRWW